MKGKRRKEFKRRGGNADQIITSISILSVSLCLLIFLTIISLTVFELKIKVDQTYKDYKLKELESKVIVTDTTKIKEQTKVREILQQTALLGLERHGFFEKAISRIY